jgi:hypothetical protein
MKTNPGRSGCRCQGTFDTGPAYAKAFVSTPLSPAARLCLRCPSWVLAELMMANMLGRGISG